MAKKPPPFDDLQAHRNTFIQKWITVVVVVSIVSALLNFRLAFVLGVATLFVILFALDAYNLFFRKQ